MSGFAIAWIGVAGACCGLCIYGISQAVRRARERRDTEEALRRSNERVDAEEPVLTRR